MNGHWEEIKEDAGCRNGGREKQPRMKSDMMGKMQERRKCKKIKEREGKRCIIN